ncbi:alpha-glucosidase/alpha-galactosidase, partial [Paenibacillus sepulcri]|nr:alpha-glucosidase/alpha-galactosidase [Paenibacillus sepulcri]
MAKISIIGAGTAMFSLSLIRDICLTPNLEGSTISFMDIDEGRLESAYALALRYAEESGIKLKLEKTLDRRESIRGAD